MADRRPRPRRASHGRRTFLAWLSAAGPALLLPRRGRALAEVLPREAWGAAPPGEGLRSHLIARVTVHHTGPPAWWGMPAAPAYLRAIQAFHQGPERGWPDIAYHLLIDLDGAVWEGRPLDYAGDTATDYDPTGHALVAVLGDYDVQQPNDAQAAALTGTVRALLERYGLGPGAVGLHRDYAATACPGRHLAALRGERTADTG